MTLKQITVVEDPSDKSTWTTVEVEDVCAFLKEHFGEVFPPTAKIYHGDANAQCDVTPNSDAAIEVLQKLEGMFFVVVYPEAPAIPYLIGALLAAIVLVALRPTPVPSAIQKNQDTPSPNNDLAARENSARPFQRIPDIYGTVRSTPDLLMLPYSEYIDNIEYEHAYMCIGRGAFNIFDARDDTTPIGSIDGASCVVFGPGDSPNIMLPAIIPHRDIFGTGAIAPTMNVARATSVNGQDLLTDSTSASLGSAATMQFSMAPAQPNGKIVFTGGEDLSDVIAGDIVYLFVKSYKTHHTTKDTHLSGNYTVVSCTTDTLILANVQSVANDWGWLRDWPGEFFVTESHIVSQVSLSVGPFILTQPDQTEIWLNVVALNGLYKLDGSGNSTAVSPSFKATIQPCDATGNPTDDPYYVTFGMTGDSRKNTVALTKKITLTTPGPCQVTLFRTTASPVSSQVSDSVKWKDLLSVTPVDVHDFGDVTTVYTITKATSGALSVKQRKLNMLVQRKIPSRISGNTFTSDLFGSNNVSDIFCAAALDPYIGGRSVTELDVDNIYNTAASIETYFGTPLPQEFCYTFDSNNLSFEEIASTIAAATFCVSYRQGSTLRLAFEQKTENSLMLFGHRNKLPKSETRSVSFGPSNDYDSVEYTYISPVDDSQVTLYIPSQATNPNKVTGAGVRNYPQAYYQAWRVWNKLVYQNTATEFEALQEAALLKYNDRILVADNTRGNIRDGEIVAQNVLELELSQPMVFDTGKSYVIFLQGIDENVESIAITVGSTPYHVVLAYAPSVTLSLAENASVRALYWIVENDDVKPQAFLVTKREPGSSAFSQKVTAINYDSRYYLNDAFVVAGSTGDDGHKTIIPVDTNDSST